MSEEVQNAASGATDNTAPAADESVLNPGAEETQVTKATDQTAETKSEGEEQGSPLLDPEPGEEEKKEEAAGEEEGEGQSAPKFESFNVPEGFTISEELQSEMETLFGELKLDQTQAQRLVDSYVSQLTAQKEAELAALNQRRKDWRAEIRSRPTFAADAAFAKKGLNAVVDTPEAREMFRNTWLSDHPVFFDAFVKIGKLVSEDAPVPSGKSMTKEVNINRVRFPVE